MTLRLLPDAELLVGELLSDCPHSASPPDQLASKVPWRTIYKIAGTAVNPRFLDAPHIQVVSWHNTRQGAINLAETARVALFNAWQSQWRGTTNVGGIHKVTEVLSPFENRSGSVDGVFRVDATYQIQTRP